MKLIAINFKGPRSLCQCGHAGDVNLQAPVDPRAAVNPGDRAVSEHAGVLGHGPCLVCPPGACEKFSWREWRPGYLTAQRMAKEARR